VARRDEKAQIVIDHSPSSNPSSAPNRNRVSVPLLVSAAIVAVGGWSSYAPNMYPIPDARWWDDVLGFAVITLVGLVFAFFQVKLQAGLTAMNITSIPLSALFGAEHRAEASMVLVSIVSFSFAIGRTAHGVFDRSPLQLVELMCYAVGLGMFVGAKLAIADTETKNTGRLR
jgi:hypothetical protein